MIGLGIFFSFNILLEHTKMPRRKYQTFSYLGDWNGTEENFVNLLEKLKC